MAKPNSYGSRANRERRKLVADKNAKAEQVDCQRCGGKHRRGRHFRDGESTPEERLLEEVFSS